MSAFKAVNIESDDESDIEIDDTKEIQIEEALKLYQTALKYHSEGPVFFEQAADAYRQLFESEIFKYPESQTELQRLDLYGPEPEVQWSEELVGPVVPTTNFDSGPSTLPQLLHISHKNYAQFKLDRLSSQFESFQSSLKEIISSTTVALDHFVQALDKDDSDLDLWQRTASTGRILDSTRVARFCLESVIDGDGEGFDGLMSLPGLDEGFAAEELRRLIVELKDTISIMQSPTSTRISSPLSRQHQQRLRPYDPLVRQVSLLRQRDQPSVTVTPERISFRAPTTWTELGECLLRLKREEDQPSSHRIPNPTISFDLENMPTQVMQTLPHQPRTDSTPTLLRRSMPVSIDEQFPGLDNGQPTVQPQIPPSDRSMHMVVVPNADGAATSNKNAETALPTRKRSNDAAGFDASEEGRARSKRLRARDSTADAIDAKQAMIEANARWEYDQHIQELQAADDWMFETVSNLFEKAGIVGFDAARHVRQELQTSSLDHATTSQRQTSLNGDLKHVRADLQVFLEPMNEQLALLLLSSSEKSNPSRGAHLDNINEMFSFGGAIKNMAPVSHMTDDGLLEFLRTVNEQTMLSQDIAWKFVEALLLPNQEDSNSYKDCLWSEKLKTTVVQVLVNFDYCLFPQAFVELDSWQSRCPHAPDDALRRGFPEMVETIFELHLDIYTRISPTDANVDRAIVAAQYDRLQRWADIAREAMHFRALPDRSPALNDSLNLRLLWTTTFHIKMSRDVTQEHVLECMNDLRDVFVAAGEPVISLPNNAVMSEMSVAALDRQISQLTLQDFFNKVIRDRHADAATVIEGLEPLLETLNPLEHSASVSSTGPDDNLLFTTSSELVRFLKDSSMSFRLSLWKRLQNAYITIEYMPMAVYCDFRMMGLLLAELKSEDLRNSAPAERLASDLQYLRQLSNVIKRVFQAVRASNDALDCIDETSLRYVVTCLGETLELIQVFNIAEDALRAGRSQPSMLPAEVPNSTFFAVMKNIHEMQVHIWVVLYALLKEAISQSPGLYANADEDKFEFLRVVHRNLGLRGICGAYDRAFVRLLKDEFFTMTHLEGYDSEQAQVLYDLYGVNYFLNPSYELMDHHCTRDAFLDRGVAAQTVDLLLSQASKLSIKDLVKHPLKDTIEKIHGTVARTKKTDTIMRNKDIYRAFVKSPINPSDLMGCLKGEGNQLPVAPVPSEDALMASKGWFFLMGHIALTRFRSQKRTAPTPTEDVDIAIAFFYQDLDYSMERWETWFRLGQAFDTKIEESVTWSAEKLNSNMSEIVLMQRQAIHCYAMATALAHRSAILEPDMPSKLTELYADFGLRLYSSSREPFGMQAFAVSKDDVDRFVSVGSGVEKVPTFRPIREYTVWKLASVFLKRALAGRTDQWNLHYLVGKCLWKMHSATFDMRQPHDQPPQAEQVLAAFIRALELVPKKDSRDSKKEPPLEPHYKLLTIVSKLLQRGSIDLQQAQEALDHTHYAKTERFPADTSAWTPYVLEVLKRLRTADKSNWYHRMIARTAQLTYDNIGTTLNTGETLQTVSADAAKQELTQQMFTKTRGLQIWRPDAERPGRHFVYTARYTRFFIKILRQLKDRVWMEALARRVRKKPNDVFEHTSVWQDICMAYLRLLRDHAGIADGLETSTFSSIAYEDFNVRKEPLEKWMQAQETGVSPALDVLREVQELKKVNQGLMKPGTIDDLIGDSYAYLFNNIGKELLEEERRSRQEEDANQPSVVQSSPRHPAMDLNHLMNADGANETKMNDAPSAEAQPSFSAQATEAVPSRRRTGIGRREIRSCAESCYQKAAPLPAKSVTPLTARPHGVVEIRRQPDLSGDTSAANSPSGSIHDSADDESELSELEEGEDEDGDGEDSAGSGPVYRSLFPGLAASMSRPANVDAASDQGEADIEMKDINGEPAGHKTQDTADGRQEIDELAY